MSAINDDDDDEDVHVRDKLETLQIIKQHLQHTNVSEWLVNELKDITTGSILPYNPYIRLMGKVSDKAWEVHMNKNLIHKDFRINRDLDNRNLPMSCFQATNDLGWEVCGLKSHVQATDFTAIQKCRPILEEVETTWRACIPSHLPFEVLTGIGFPTFLGTNSSSSQHTLLLFSEFVMKGPSKEDGVFVFAKLAFKFCEQFEDVLYVHIDNVEIWNLHDEDAQAILSDKLSEGHPFTIECIHTAPDKRTTVWYKLRVRLHISSSQLKSTADFSVGRPWAALQSGVFLSTTMLKKYAALFPVQDAELKSSLVLLVPSKRKQATKTKKLGELLELMFIHELERTPFGADPDVTLHIALLRSPLIKLEGFQNHLEVILYMAENYTPLSANPKILAFMESLTFYLADVFHSFHNDIFNRISKMVSQTLTELARSFNASSVREVVYLLGYARAMVCESLFPFFRELKLLDVVDLPVAASTDRADPKPDKKGGNKKNSKKSESETIGLPPTNSVVEEHEKWLDRIINISQQDVAALLQEFQLDSIAWGLNDRMFVNVAKEVRDSRMMKAIRQSVILAKYLADSHLDDIVSNFLFQVCSSSLLPPNPYIMLEEMISRGVWRMEMKNTNDDRLKKILLKTEPVQTQQDGIYSLPSSRLFGAKSSLFPLVERKLLVLCESIVRCRFDVPGSVDLTCNTTVWFQAPFAFSSSFEDNIHLIEFREHHHIISSQRKTALKDFVKSFSKSLIERNGNAGVGLLGVEMSSEGWGREELTYDNGDFERSLELAFSSRERVCVRFIEVVGGRYVVTKKLMSLSISTRDGTPLLSPDSIELGLELKTGVFTSLLDAEKAQTMRADCGSCQVDEMKRRISKELHDSSLSHNYLSLCQWLVWWSCVHKDWVLLPALFRIYSSIVYAISTVQNMLGIWERYLRASERVEDDQERQERRQERTHHESRDRDHDSDSDGGGDGYRAGDGNASHRTEMGSFGADEKRFRVHADQCIVLLRRVLSVGCLRYPRFLIRKLVAYLVRDSHNMDDSSIRSVREELHVLRQVVLSQLVRAEDDVMNTLHVELETHRWGQKGKFSENNDGMPREIARKEEMVNVSEQHGVEERRTAETRSDMMKRTTTTTSERNNKEGKNNYYVSSGWSF
eukprot:m.32577 g.32577  ORF g.32577 m.32577 type:complete len:1141 (+) comp9795_c0_seq2:260-3682(+)